MSSVVRVFYVNEAGEECFTDSKELSGMAAGDLYHRYRACGHKVSMLSVPKGSREGRPVCSRVVATVPAVAKAA